MTMRVYQAIQHHGPISEAGIARRCGLQGRHHRYILTRALGLLRQAGLIRAVKLGDTEAGYVWCGRSL